MAGHKKRPPQELGAAQHFFRTRLTSSPLDGDDHLRRGALGALHDVELHQSALSEALEAFRLNRVVVEFEIVQGAKGPAAENVVTV